MLAVTLVASSCATSPDEGAGAEGGSSAQLLGAETGLSKAWFHEYPAVTVTLVRGSDPAGVVRAMYPDDLTEVPGEAAARATPEDHAWVAAGSIDGWTFVWEDNGFQGTDLDAVEELSRGTRLVSAFWNVNDLIVATVAEDGVVTRQFEPANRTDARNTIGTPLPAEGWLDWDHDPTGSILRLQAQLTAGSMADPSWLERSGVRFWTHSL